MREAVANMNLESEDKSISDYVDGMCNIVDAVFARVGYDISHYENLDELKEIVLRLIAEAEGLSSDLQQTIKDFENDQNLDGDEVAAMLDKVVPRIKSIVDLVKTVSDVEWEEISKELASASNTVRQSIEEQFRTELTDAFMEILEKSFEKIENGTNRKILIYSTLFQKENPLFHICSYTAKLCYSNNIFNEKSTVKLGKIFQSQSKY